jgi:hypothetical protein
MRTSTFVFHGVPQAATPGAAPGLDALPFPVPTTLDQIAGVTAMGSPLPLLDSLTPIAFTFSTFQTTASDNTPQRRWATARALSAAILSQPLGKAIALDIIDDTGVSSGRRALDDQDWRAQRLRLQARAAGAALLPNAQPVFPDRLPAITYSDTICRLLSEIQRHLLETPDGGVTWSLLFSAAEVLRLINERLVRFLLETGILRKRSQISVGSGTPTVDLPSDLIEVRRVAWAGATVSGLARMDPFGMDAGLPGWEGGSGTPYAYVEEPLPALQVRLVQTPSANGTLDVIYVYDPATLTGLCSLAIPLPAMFVPHVKYGVLADLLSKEGEASDPQRAGYCESRFAEGVELARLMLGTKS